MRTEKSDLRLRDRFHHQCYAYRSQSGASQRYEVTEWTNHNIDPIQHTTVIKMVKKKNMHTQTGAAEKFILFT